MSAANASRSLGLAPPDRAAQARIGSGEGTLRVLVLIDNLGPGGAERLIVPLALGLRERGDDVRVAHLQSRGGNPRAAELRAAGVTVIDLGLRTLLDPRTPLRLARLLRQERIDLVHAHLRYATLVGSLAGRLAGVPTVTTLHTIVETGTGIREALRRTLDDLAARWLCSRVIAVSDAQRRAYCRRAGIAPARVTTVWNGVDSARFRPNPALRAELRARLGVSERSVLFTAVMVLRPGKGVEYLLRAIALLRTEPDARFLVVGDGPERGRLEDETRSLGVQEQVQFLGSRADVPDLLAASDVYVHPSLWEALPTSVLEAMAVGLPVVATAVGGTPELVQEGQTGVLVPPGDPRALAEALRRLLDPGLRERMGAAGRLWLQRNASQEVWLVRLDRVYREVAPKAQ